ncbi:MULTISPECIES: hypothetical protein [unclassified Bradyrhizobium]|uniref:hypothetical protein n=1 Tax=unclassified Bradyrhizobium TaxID=2631580 RepID=UPI0028EAF8B7|nr:MULTISPECIES: hypothetical protein [unclassified Bradyrhizobium]
MNNDPLLSCWIKIDRANKHLNDLIKAMEAFQHRYTQDFVADEESEPTIKIYRVRILEDIPANLSGYIGDVVHNLRSALDCLAVALIKRVDPTVGDDVLRDTYFPIAWDESGLSNERRTRFFNRVGAPVEKLIRRVQPYRGGKGHVLWQLEHLDITDKHRQIIPGLLNVSHITFYVMQPVNGNPISRPKYEPPFPLKDGDEICRVAFSEPNYNSSVHFQLEIAFNEPPFVVAKPVAITLKQFVYFVHRLIDIFREQFF